MEFKNLTPFAALDYAGIDTQDREYHVVAMRVGYQLVRKHPDLDHASPMGMQYIAEAMEQEPVSLCMADEHFADPDKSSMRMESDLIPYKPKCDILVTGHAYAYEHDEIYPSNAYTATLQVSSNNKKLIDKTLNIYGGRYFQREISIFRGGVGAYELKLGTMPNEPLSTDNRITRLPLRYEYAYGGSVQVPAPAKIQAKTGEKFLLNEVCYRNPYGCGWVEESYFSAISSSENRQAYYLRAPQITLENEKIRKLTETKQKGSKTAKEMAEVKYPFTPAGFGPLCKAWAPRLAKAGTYDDTWLKNRHPYLPKDFNFAYWNGAPEDQQIAFPTPGKLDFALYNLKPGGGWMTFQLPAHRALVLADLGGVNLPFPMQIDTIIFNTDKLQLEVVWRTALLKSAMPEKLEARFEVNPNAPLVKYKEIPA